jgi:Protein of unknown function (DUF3592)
MVILYLVGVGFTLVGCFFVVFGRRRWARSRRWPRVTGMITGAKTLVDGDGIDSIRSPVVAFEVAGRTVHAESPAFDNVHAYRPGRKVPVRYDPERPERAVVDLIGQNGLMHQAVGGLVMLFGIAILGGLLSRA